MSFRTANLSDSFAVLAAVLVIFSSGIGICGEDLMFLPRFLLTFSALVLAITSMVIKKDLFLGIKINCIKKE